MKIEIQLQPFSTPSFVRQVIPSGIRGEGQIFALSAVPATSLSELCDQFRKDVFEKAGKKDPKLAMPRR